MAKVIRTYYSCGKLESECFELNGKEYGEYKRYHPNGRVWMIISYIDGNKNGEQKEYNDNGQLVSTCIYIDNKKNGDEIIYYENWYSSSSLFEDIPLDNWLNANGLDDNGLDANGLDCNLMNSDLTIDSICQYVEDKRHGEWKVYNSDGSLMKIMSYINGVKQSEIFMEM
jgi:hypothetical protein